MIDFKSLLKKHATELFNIHATLQSLKFSPYYQPLLRYNRDSYPDAEMYWCEGSTPAPLEIVWATSYGAPSLQPPAEVQQRALELLRELDSQRELVALYRCGHVKDDVFTLSCWLIPFPADYKKEESDGGGVYYTITQDGTLGLAKPYDANEELCAALI